MASKTTSPMINGPGRRKLDSWIESFVEHTSGLESAEIYRRWSAIGMIAATLEQKVWVETQGVLYPNMYIFLVGHPGIGKSRAIVAASNIVREALPEIHFGATSMTRASLADYMNEAKVFKVNLPHAPLEYNSLLCVADEFSAFMHEYDSGLVAALVEFYDVNPYSEGRRVSNIRIKIKRPQLNILSGSTPSNLIHTLKDYVWDQGLMSRVLLIYTNTRPMIDVFNSPPPGKPTDLIYDLKIINTLTGKMEYTEKFAKAMHDWKIVGQAPVPSHPKLKHYNTRRWAHLLKLCMVACVDRGNDLVLDIQDFNRAMSWLFEAELAMPFIFKEGSVTPDSRVMDEVVHFVSEFEKGVSEHLIIGFLRERVGSNSIRNIMDALVSSREIISKDIDKSGLRIFKKG